MRKFIIFTFLMLGWTFYEMSGGADFVAQERQVAQVAVVEPEPEVQVTRASFSTLDVLPAQVVATPQADVVLAVATPTPAVAEVIEDAPEVTLVSLAQPAPVDLRQVSGARVNMRSGPGTDYRVLDTLTRGTSAEIIEMNQNGWARIRVQDTGQIGWMSARLLTNG